MKRPIFAIKKPQIVRHETPLFGSYLEYSPEDLRKLADQMEEQGMTTVEFEIEGHDGYFCATARTLETEEQANWRYATEKKAYDKWQKAQNAKKEKRKAALLAEAKKLGLKVGP